MADFSLAHKKTSVFEGGYQKHPNDNGNWTGGAVNSGTLVGTNWGISAPAYKTYFGKTPTEQDMRNLTQDQAKAIYRSLFWNKIKGDEINNQQVAEIIYDAYVNQTGWTRIMTADTLTALNRPATVKVPFNNETVMAINTTNPAQFFQQFLKERERRYRETAARPGQSVFLAGWLSRLNGFSASGLAFLKSNWAAVVAITIVAGLGTFFF